MIPRLSSVFLVASLGLASVQAQNLAETSPFMPVTRQVAPTVTENAPLELRGIMGQGDERMFSIYNPSTKQSLWVRLNEPGREFVVRTHDDAAATISVEYGGRALNLKLTEARIATLAAAPDRPRPSNVPSPAMPGPAARTPTPEQMRALENVQAEVERRRNARNEALKSQ